MRRESAAPVYQYDTLERQKKSGHGRLSATFSESRPWNFISSSQAIDRSSSSSRKRRSLFGHRSSTTPSTTSTAEAPSSRMASPRVSLCARRETDPAGSRPEPTLIQSPRTSFSGMDSWRSSIFSRRRSTRAPTYGEHVTESGAPLSRYGSRTLTMKATNDSRHRDDESEDACESDSVSLLREMRMLTNKVYHQLKKNSISPPFNFQHITHTQKNQLPEMEAVTDRELVSEFWAASAYQAPQRELRGISAETIEKDRRQWREIRQQNDAQLPDQLAFKKGQLAGTPSNVNDHSSYSPETPSDVDVTTPLSEGKRSFTQDGRSRSLTLHGGLSSTERLATLGIEQREPPAMLHPAFRPPSAGSTPIYELPAMSLDSVPEESEHATPMYQDPEAQPVLEDSLSVSPRSSPFAAASHACKFTPFPFGNAFAQAHGGTGLDLTMLSNDQTFSGEESIPSLTSGESWENEVDLLYLVEAESTCDFDWSSVKSSRKGSEGSQNRRDSGATSSVRTNSVRDDASIRPQSHRNSAKSYPDDGLFAGFDGTSPFNTLLSAQKLLATSPAKRHSAISASNVELSTIPELTRELAASGDNSSSETITKPSHGKHRRSASYSGQRPEPPKRSARWSIASPLYLPEDVKLRRPSFTLGITASLAEQMLFTAPLFPPPVMPLPEVPKSKPCGLISPPISPPTQNTSEFSMRRPSTPQDRALLQAAGRIVQRGRSARPATPSRLSQVQNAKTPSPRTVAQTPATPPKAPIHFKVAVFPTPPNSPPQQQQHYEEYPAWI